MIRMTMAEIGRKFATGVVSGARRLAPALGMALMLMAPPPVTAQGFEPVARIDGAVITGFELAQRQRFLTLLRAPGDVRALALDQLINERLQLREAAKAGVTVSDEDVDAGIAEFAARGKLSTEQFLQLLARGGIAPETIRDYVTAGVTWREFVRATFLSKVSLSSAEIAAAMGETEPEAGLQVLLSEIALPAGDEATRRASTKRAGRLTGLDEAGFADAAKRFSIGRTRTSGGELSWTDVAKLPPSVGAAVRGLQPGQTTRPLPVEDEIRVYYMRDRDQVSGGTPTTVVDYAALMLPGGASQANLDAAAKIRAEVTTCDDLYPIARALPPEQLVREELREAAVPAPYGAEIATLDPGEISTRLTTSGGAMVVLMLCNRGNELPKSTTEEAVAAQLRNTRVGAMAQAYLDELKANAAIDILR